MERVVDAPNGWTGALVRLRAVEPDDWEAFHALDEDSELQRLGEQIQFPRSTAAAREWASDQAKRRSDDDDRCLLAIERLADELLLGSIAVGRADRRHGRFSYGLGLGREHLRQGYGSEAVHMLLGHFFEELRYERCDVEVYEFNEASIAFHRALGFVEEGRRRGAVFTSGRRWDEVLFGMTRAEFTAVHGAEIPEK